MYHTGQKIDWLDNAGKPVSHTFDVLVRVSLCYTLHVAFSSFSTNLGF